MSKHLDRHGVVLYDPLSDVDETKLNRVDRLGLAYCRLNSWAWDEYIGPKPAGFDQLPAYDKYNIKRIEHPVLMKILTKLNPKKYGKVVSKCDYLTPAVRRIEAEIGYANISRCWWVYKLKRTEEEWRKWYYSADRLKYTDDTELHNAE